MSGDRNGYGGQARSTGTDGSTPWTVRPGAPEYEPADGRDPYVPQDPYGTTVSTRSARRAAARRNAGGGNGRRGRPKKSFRGIVIGVVIALVVGGVATWLALAGGGDDADSDTAAPPDAGAGPEVTRPTFRPAPTVPPAPGGEAVLADPALDTGPFTPEALFPAPQITVNGRTYAIVARQLDNNCADTANPALAEILRGNACAQVIRITATGPDGTAATVAVGSFANPDDAKAAAAQGNANRDAALLGLPGGPVPVLCPVPQPNTPAVICARQTNSLGRYGVFLIGGYPGPENRIDPAKGDPKVDQLGTDLDRAAREALAARGEKRSQAIYDAAKAEAEKAIQGQ
ncbi:hypothetical protein LO772_13985 [Yinghuangia sp. ASG 101]|uniref:hypothetical protein n=1 Tax=Yinghuangia sp. ASG 101 TaxID=2896848 RepID=UPI001E39E9CA|nr:hypothetical protein [Yinghuangia sp. ASG 101]UGQ14593.1 hypothetical protein LO772_13985 [Yinghuangia sp. ASG 101]